MKPKGTPAARHRRARVVAMVLALVQSACASVPQGDGGPAADALAREVEAWVDRAAWERTGAVAFDFSGFRSFVWDRQREFLLARKDTLEVSLDLRDRGGVATDAGRALAGDALREALDDAWTWFCNDTFWLNPLVKLFDGGTRREVVAVDEGRGLKVTYGAGGVTPGDTYVWLVGDDGRPLAVRMWVQVLPLKGLEFRWDGWVTLATGAKVATSHKALGKVETPSIQGLRAASTLRELLGAAEPDPFEALAARRAAASVR